MIAGDGDDDSLFGGEGSDQIDGGDGNDYLSGNGGYVYGEGEAVADSLSGGAGNDTIDAGYSDVVDGGAGIDVLAYYGHGGPTGVSVDFRQLTSGGTISIGGGTISGIEFVGYISLSDLNDTVVAGAAPGIDGTTIIGWGGDDDLTGSSSNDGLYGESGNDILDGAAGDDFLHGGNGIDRFKYALGGGQDRISDLTAGETVEIRGYEAAQSIAQVGADVVVVLSASDRITLRNTDLATVQAALRFVDAVPTTPTAGDDTLTGTAAADAINGLGGNDTIYGLGGNDTLDGGAGNDILDGGIGGDTLRGGVGNDTYLVDSALDRITEASGAGTDEVRATVNYTLGSSVSVEKMTAAGSAAVNLTGNELAQTLVGDDWGNVLSGAAGNDTLFGAGGADTLKGGLGADVLWGGAGADLFSFSEKGRRIANDQVMDFEKGIDKVDLRPLAITSGNVKIAISGGNTLLSIDADRNGRADYAVTLVGVTNVDSSDLLFS